jgi:hypothetical protein
VKYLLLLICAWLAVGCAASSTANGPALVHPNFPYAVSYDDEAEKTVMGDDWRLTTYRYKDKAGPNDPPELERKDGFDATYELDFNDDDKADAKVKLPIPDLLFTSKRTNARLEVVTLLLDNHNSRKELRVLVDDIVDGGNGTRSLFVGFGRATAGVEKRYATKIIDTQEASLGNQKGLVVTLEQVDLDKKEADPNAAGRRSRLFLMRAPFSYFASETKLTTTTSSTNSTSTSYGLKSKTHEYPVLLLVEYSNAPSDYEPQYPEFLRLLGKLHMLSDERLLAYLAPLVAPCNQTHANDTELSLDISPLGTASVHASLGFDSVCLSNAVSSYNFVATGEARVVKGKFDFSKPVPKPEWLAQSEYQEQRPVPSTAPAAPATEAPAPAEAPSEPAAAPPAPQPGG